MKMMKSSYNLKNNVQQLVQLKSLLQMQKTSVGQSLPLVIPQAALLVRSSMRKEALNHLHKMEGEMKQAEVKMKDDKEAKGED